MTERFALKSKYFYDEANRDAYREQHESMPFHEKSTENTPLAVGGIVLVAPVLL